MPTTTTRFALSKPASGDNVSSFQGTVATTLDAIDAALIGFQGGAYAGGTTYHQGDVVTLGGNYYMSTTTQSGVSPPGATWVQAVGVPTFTTAAVATSGTSTSASYTNSLTTAGATPSVSAVVTGNGALKIIASAKLDLGVSTSTTFCTFALSGANTLSAADSNGGGPMYWSDANTLSLWVMNTSHTWLVTGLAAGATTVQLYWKVTAGTANIANQVLIVEAY